MTRQLLPLAATTLFALLGTASAATFDEQADDASAMSAAAERAPSKSNSHVGDSSKAQANGQGQGQGQGPRAELGQASSPQAGARMGGQGGGMQGQGNVNATPGQRQGFQGQMPAQSMERRAQSFDGKRGSGDFGGSPNGHSPAERGQMNQMNRSGAEAGQVGRSSGQVDRSSMGGHQQAGNGQDTAQGGQDYSGHQQAGNSQGSPQGGQDYNGHQQGGNNQGTAQGGQDYSGHQQAGNSQGNHGQPSSGQANGHTRPTGTNGHAANSSRASNTQAANHTRASTGHAQPNHSRPAYSQSAASHRAAAARGAAHRPAYRPAVHRSAYYAHHSRYVPARWRPAVHRHVVANRYPHWHPHYWGAGVFVYTTPPHARVVVRGGGDVDGGQQSQVERAPERAVDRNGDFSIGVRSGSYMSGYDDGFGGFGDFGLGVAARYRPVESLGFELSWQHHDQTWNAESERTTNPLSASVELFAFPWTHISPYVLGGVTWTDREYNDTFFNGYDYETASVNDTLFGPHGGIGVEFAIGKNTSINLESKYTGYVNAQPDDPSVPGAFQGNAGLNVYF